MDGAAGPEPGPAFDERFEDSRFLIRDRGSNFTASFDAVFQAGGVTIVWTAVRAPRMNATCERLAGTLRRELLDRVLILGEAHLRAVLAEYQEHYNTARPHQGIAQRIPDRDSDAFQGAAADLASRRIRRKPVLNGLSTSTCERAQSPVQAVVQGHHHLLCRPNTRSRVDLALPAAGLAVRADNLAWE